MPALSFCQRSRSRPGFLTRNKLKSAKDLLQAASGRGGKAIMVFVQLPEEPTTDITENDGQPSR
ncbi:hypothetical protein ACWCQN_46140 [Streptomyces sp. NPDC001984]|uniref:hypothetical protein n=1 Tax=Streptomyces sp. NPDC002619 TaxID=3364655 RepID=UPI0036CD6BF4